MIPGITNSDESEIFLFLPPFYLRHLEEETPPLWGGYVGSINCIYSIDFQKKGPTFLQSLSIL